MSRIGQKPIAVPQSVSVSIDGRTVSVQGDKGALSFEHRPEVAVSWDADEKQIRVTRSSDQKRVKGFHGMTRSLIMNMVTGVAEGFRTDLEITGVGWTARVEGQEVALTVGYADTRRVGIVSGTEVSVQGNRIAVSGVDKQAVGQMAAAIRAQRPPEPYNGKGIRYADEQVVRKEGKAFGG